MRMRKPWIIVLAGLALALSYSIPARAITANTANAKAAGYQHYECHARGAHCIDPNYRRTHCHGPMAGGTQWGCYGSVTLWYVVARKTLIYECDVASRWGPWGNLTYGARYCHVVRIQDN